MIKFFLSNKVFPKSSRQERLEFGSGRIELCYSDSHLMAQQCKKMSWLRLYITYITYANTKNGRMHNFSHYYLQVSEIFLPKQ